MRYIIAASALALDAVKRSLSGRSPERAPGAGAARPSQDLGFTGFFP